MMHGVGRYNEIIAVRKELFRSPCRISELLTCAASLLTTALSSIRGVFFALISDLQTLPCIVSKWLRNVGNASSRSSVFYQIWELSIFVEMLSTIYQI